MQRPEWCWSTGVATSSLASAAVVAHLVSLVMAVEHYMRGLWQLYHAEWEPAMHGCPTASAETVYG